jgi:DNA-directed RNA polymerase beta subunit
LIAYGMGSFIKESMMERSDKYEFALDKELGTVVSENKQEGTYINHYGEAVKDIARVRAPYSWKLLLQEIDAFGMSTQLITEEPHEDEDGEDDYVADAELIQSDSDSD